MIYLVCFCIALVMLLFIVAYEKAMDYVKENTTKKTPVKTYGYKGQIYRYEIAKLMSSKKWSIGYLIKVRNVTEVIRENAKVPSEQTDEEKSQI